MAHLHLDSLELFCAVLDQCNSQLQLGVETEVNISPNALDVAIRNILIHIRVVGRVIVCCEMVSTLSLPDSKCAITHLDVAVGVVPCQPRYEVPGSILAGK